MKKNLMHNNIYEATSIIISQNLAYSGPDEVIEKIKEKKPELTDSEILEGINCAKKKLWKDEYLTDKIKRELQMWDNVD